MNLAGHHFHQTGRCGHASINSPLVDREIYSAIIPDAALSDENGRDPGNTDRRISIRLVGSDGLRHSACDLINRRYGWRGYGSNHRLQDKPATTSFIASIDDEIVGTITLTVDSPAGLAADHIFREEIDAVRNISGAHVCELTKFAFDTDIPSKPLLAALFHIVFIYGQRRYQCTDLFIEVNPRHRRFYQSLLGFKRVGDLKTNESVEAPSQLMSLKVEDIAAMIDAHRYSPLGAEARSLYPFFLSLEEEEAVHSRLYKTSGPLGSPWADAAMNADIGMSLSS
jgi:hypothetical protein